MVTITKGGDWERKGGVWGGKLIGRSGHGGETQCGEGGYNHNRVGRGLGMERETIGKGNKGNHMRDWEGR